MKEKEDLTGPTSNGAMTEVSRLGNYSRVARRMARSRPMFSFAEVEEIYVGT